MRSVIETLESVLEVIPDDEQVKRDLQVFKDDIFMELPEGNAHLWRGAAEILHEHFPQDLEQWQDWHDRAFKVWKGE